VVQGAKDDIVLPSQSAALVDRLDQAHDAARLLMVSHAGHGLVQQGSQPITPGLATLVDEVTSFLTRELSPHG
jgi:dipeptidyl aminopeptidase/acylaminoacyl peptidase